MRAYVIRRLLLLLPTLFVLSVMVFLSVRFLPGDVIDVMLGRMEWQAAGGIDRQALERMLGLDVPVWVQYGRWLGGILLHGSLGESLMGGWPVRERMFSRLPVTFELGVMAILIGLVIALPVGIYSAVRQYTAADYVGRSVAIMGLATPNFWLGTMVMVYPAIWWAWSPPMEFLSLSEDPLGNLGMFLIPSLILGTYLSASTMRMTRTMMLEVLRQDYIRTAWAKGLLERSVILRHAVKNAIIPVVTLVGMQLPILVGGSVIIENIFNLPGLGAVDAGCAQRPRLPGGVGGEFVLRHGGGSGQPGDRSAVRVAGPRGFATNEAARSLCDVEHRDNGAWGSARWPPFSDQQARPLRDAEDWKPVHRVRLLDTIFGLVGAPMGDVSQLTPAGAEPATGAVAAG